MIKIIVGSLLFFASLWIGSYLQPLTANSDTWWAFPTYLTTCLLMTGGAVTVAFGLADITNPKP